ncbi:hypothetical protein V8D89_002602 [Ganoderma adspersum]
MPYVLHQPVQGAHISEMNSALQALASTVALSACCDPDTEDGADTHAPLTQAESMLEIELQTSEGTASISGSCTLGTLSTTSRVCARYMTEGEGRGGSIGWDSGSMDMTPS